MDGHSVRTADVCSDESVSPALRIHPVVWTAGCSQLLRLDCACKELSADDYQCSGNNPMRHRVNPSFWLTAWTGGAIIHTLKQQQGATQCKQQLNNSYLLN